MAQNYIEDISYRFGDGTHLASNLTQASRIYAPARAMGLAEEDFVTLISEARTRTTAARNIRARNADGSVNRMPYFFDLLKKEIVRVIAIWTEEDRLRAEVEAQRGGES